MTGTEYMLSLPPGYLPQVLIPSQNHFNVN